MRDGANAQSVGFLSPSSRLNHAKIYYHQLPRMMRSRWGRIFKGSLSEFEVRLSMNQTNSSLCRCPSPYYCRCFNSQWRAPTFSYQDHTSAAGLPTLHPPSNVSVLPQQHYPASYSATPSPLGLPLLLAPDNGNSSIPQNSVSFPLTDATAQVANQPSATTTEEKTNKCNFWQHS